jgi:type IV pilus assembly protein PilC
MAKFKYSATNATGQTISGIEDAVTVGQARATLAQRDLDVLEIAEKKSVLRLELTKSKVKRKDLMHFSRQLSVFIRAGIPIIDGLETIAEDTGSKPLQKALVEMAESLRSGATFADAAEAHPNAFPSMYLGILRSAELTGNLDIVLDQLADYIERDVEARQKIMGALIYPLVILAMSAVSLVILVSYVLPKFQEFFEGLEADLPLPTRMIINAGNFFSSWWWLLGATLVGMIVLLVITLRTERGKVARDRLMLRVPVIGGIVEYAVLERFCRILSSMVSAGVPLPVALNVASDATNNRVYRSGLQVAREAMIRGEGLANPMAASGLFPPAARQMFRVGEDTGSLDSQMEVAASYFDRELDYRLKRFTSLFEPAVILVAGGIVGFIAIALVSAMYGIFQQVDI